MPHGLLGRMSDRTPKMTSQNSMQVPDLGLSMAVWVLLCVPPDIIGKELRTFGSFYPRSNIIALIDSPSLYRYLSPYSKYLTCNFNDLFEIFDIKDIFHRSNDKD